MNELQKLNSELEEVITPIVNKFQADYGILLTNIEVKSERLVAASPERVVGITTTIKNYRHE